MNDCVVTKTGVLHGKTTRGGGTVIGNTKQYGGGGGNARLQGRRGPTARHTMFQTSKKDFFTLRSEAGERGRMRSRLRGPIQATVGWTHNFRSRSRSGPSRLLRNYDQPAFDLGTKQGMWLAGSTTLRF